MFRKVEAPVGFEPTNKAFAELPLKPLGYSANKTITNYEFGIENEKRLRTKLSTKKKNPESIGIRRAGNGT